VKGILKWPLLIAAVVVVLRVVVEQLGAPDSVANLFSVVALHLAVGPVYFAIMLARSGVPRPYGELIKVIALYVVLTRAMVLPTYWLARIFTGHSNDSEVWRTRHLSRVSSPSHSKLRQSGSLFPLCSAEYAVRSSWRSFASSAASPHRRE
jgi:hypothetical protein